jgi:hypothetical protein
MKQLSGAEPKWPGEGLQSLFWLVQFQPAPPPLPIYPFPLSWPGKFSLCDILANGEEKAWRKSCW